MRKEDFSKRTVPSRWKTLDVTEIQLADDAWTYGTAPITDHCSPDQQQIFHLIFCIKSDENDREPIPLTSALSAAEADLELTDYLQAEYALFPMVLKGILKDLHQRNMVQDESIHKPDIAEQDIVDIVSKLLDTEMDSKPDENECVFDFPERDFTLKSGRILRNIRCRIKLEFSVTTRTWCTLHFLSVHIDSDFTEREKNDENK